MRKYLFLGLMVIGLMIPSFVLAEGDNSTPSTNKVIPVVSDPSSQSTPTPNTPSPQKQEGSISESTPSSLGGQNTSYVGVKTNLSRNNHSWSHGNVQSLLKKTK